MRIGILALQGAFIEHEQALQRLGVPILIEPHHLSRYAGELVLLDRKGSSYLRPKVSQPYVIQITHRITSQ